MSNTPVDLNGLSKDGVLSASEEAKNAPTLFQPKERAEYVKARVDEARKLRALGQNDEQIKAAMGSFVTQYPTLFQMAMSEPFDERQFKIMLGVLDRMAGGMTQHEASIRVGQVLVDKYVMPLVNSGAAKKK
jgi:hypothetical protein